MEDDSHLCRNRKTSRQVREHARTLRNTQTPTEQILWERIRRCQLGVKFRRQHAVAKLILDFYCAELRLGIEIDGGIHLRPDVKGKDQYKSAVMEDQGIVLLCFSNDAVVNGIDGVVERIMKEIHLRKLEYTR